MQAILCNITYWTFYFMHNIGVLKWAACPWAAMEFDEMSLVTASSSKKWTTFAVIIPKLQVTGTFLLAMNNGQTNRR